MVSNQTNTPAPSGSSKAIGIAILVLALLALCGGGWLLYREMQKEDTMPGVKSDPANASEPKSVIDTVVNKVKETVSNVVAKPKNPFPLSKGSRGEEVKNVQQYLNVRWKTTLDPDGVWGSKTDAALMTHEKTSSVSQAEYLKLKSWLDTFPHDFSVTIKPKDVVINQNRQTPDFA